MKVSGTRGASDRQGDPRKARPAGGDGFQPATPAARAPAQVARTTGVAGVMSVDALLALQDVGGPLERNAGARWAAPGWILDVLEEVKVSDARR